MTTETKLAIVNNVKTDHSVTAICEFATYDVWGNDRDGFEVNDVYRQGEIEIPAECRISNVPLHPGARDDFREFSDCSSFSAELCVSFELTDKAIRKAIDANVAVDIESDGEVYNVNQRSNGMPLCELRVVRWEA